MSARVSAQVPGEHIFGARHSMEDNISAFQQQIMFETVPSYQIPQPVQASHQDWDALMQPQSLDGLSGLTVDQLDLLCEGIPTSLNNLNGTLSSQSEHMIASEALLLQSVTAFVPPAPRISNEGSEMSDFSKQAVSDTPAPLPDPGDDSDQDDFSSQKSYSSKDEGETCWDETELAKEPWFRTLKSAGVRIKGRTRKELEEVAERIRKRRRESAARSRARRINKVSTIADQNECLRRENEELKRMIAAIQTSQMLK